MTRDEKLTARTITLINQGKNIILRKKPAYKGAKLGAYLGQHTCVQAGPDLAHWTNRKSCAMEVFNLKWAFAIAELYDCRVYSVKGK